tara:strand:- start:87 stop:257 length:171 start_codon:yes stop_codon:yes gene_type:complete
MSLARKVARKRELSSKILYWEGQLKQAKYYLERYNAERDELVSEIHQLRIDIVGGE